MHAESRPPLDPAARLAVPLLTTDRLLMRCCQLDDFPAYAELVGDPVSARQMGGPVLDRDQAWRALAGTIGHWVLRGFGRWAVTCRESGRFIGIVGFLEPAGWPEMELAWSIRRPDWGQGLATEAARAAMSWAIAALEISHVVHLIAPHNVASIRVAEKLGAVKDSEIEFHGEPTWLYRTVVPR